MQLTGHPAPKRVLSLDVVPLFSISEEINARLLPPHVRVDPEDMCHTSEETTRIASSADESRHIQKSQHYRSRAKNKA